MDRTTYKQKFFVWEISGRRNLQIFLAEWHIRLCAEDKYLARKETAAVSPTRDISKSRLPQN